MKQIQKYLPLVFLSFVMLFATQVNGQTEDIDVAKLQEVLSAKDKKENVVLLDVRTGKEFGEGYIHGAVNYNFLEEGFESNLEKLDKSKAYYVYCFSGGRSARAVKKMKGLGFENVHNVTGGIRAWTAAGYDIKGGTVVK